MICLYDRCGIGIICENEGGDMFFVEGMLFLKVVSLKKTDEIFIDSFLELSTINVVDVVFGCYD